METGGDNRNIGERDLHQTSQLAEQGHGSPNNNNHLEAHPSSSSSSPPNPFLVSSDATNNTGNGSTNNDTSSTNPSGSTHHSSTNDTLGLHSSITPSANESSLGNAFHEPTNTDTKTPSGALESWQQNQRSACETSEDDAPVSSMPKHGHDDVSGGTSQGSEIQNPPVQVMERPGESGTSPQYIFPSHVFSKSNINSPVEWSTASNESLFSIYMGNMSFSNELVCFKSCEMDKPGDVCIHDQPNASPTQQPPASQTHQPPAPVNKFNDISQRTAELRHQESSRVTEAKAAETMREVIMESSRTTENVGKGDDKVSNSHRQSDGSTNSYAFQSSKDRDKSVSSKGAGEKQNQQKQSEENETSNAADQAPKSTTNAPNKWLNCFSCCTSCH
ncbi:hypothetical protein E2542_SST19439 [Spatholobus suberectus]|nr:hypothetical protein E2542_SST19439 [Spatholobus suberectus]